MRKIPPKLRKEIEESGINKFCALCGSKNNVEWHHVWIYAGKQINEKWAIVGACKEHHDRVNKELAIREFFEVISLIRATDKDLEKYPRKNWNQAKKYLKIKTDDLLP